MDIKINLPIEVKNAIKLLEKSGYSAFVVGGCVRDSMLGITPYDWDITTNAKPNEIEKVFSGYKIIENGIKHGTVTIIINKNQIEITTFRIDGEYSDNRHPDSVIFTNDLEIDLSRRDFTVNALAYNDQKGIVDYFNGTDDIKNQIIRCVGNPDERFNEDALRIMRAIRFSSTLMFKVEKNTSESVIKNKELLNNVAVERISNELLKLLQGENVKNVLLEYKDVIAVFIPELKGLFDYPQNTPYHCFDAFTHTALAVEAAPNSAPFKLAMLLHDIGKPFCHSVDEKGLSHFYGHPKVSAKMALEILKRLKFDNITIDRVVKIVSEHDAHIPKEKKQALKLLSRIGEDCYRDIITAKYADNMGKANPHKDDEKLKQMELYLYEILSDETCFSLKQLDINGKDIIDFGIIDGIEIGKALDFLLDAVIDGKCNNNKAELLYYLSKFFNVD